MVSILLPACSEELLLDRSLRSIAAQTYSAWEIIAINDGSRDHTADILHAWQSLLGPQRLRILTHATPQGLSISLNEAIAAATGSLLARLDADDWWTPDKLARQVAVLSADPGCGIVGCDYINHGTGWQRPVRLPTTDDQIRRTIFRRNPFGHSCVLMRTDVVRAVGGYDERVVFGQDWDLWFRLLAVTELRNIPRFLCHRTVREPSPRKRQGQLRQAIRTVATYTRRYHASPFNYVYLTESVAAAVAPRWVKRVLYRLQP